MVPKPDLSTSAHCGPEDEIETQARVEVDRPADAGQTEFMEPDGEIEPALQTSEDDELLILSPLTDEFDEKVAEAQEQLLHLRHQQEQLEKQKAELEEMKRKREKFLRGRAEATDRLTKATTMLESEMFESQQRLEQLGHARDAFDRHLETLDSINPEDWERDEMRTELSRALAAIQEARDEYTTEMARIGATAKVAEPDIPLPLEMEQEQEPTERGEQAVAAVASSPSSGAPAEARDFLYWLKSGFAFTLPLLIFGIFALVLLLLVF